MIISPYDTTACRAYDTKVIQSTLQVATVDDELLSDMETPSGRAIRANLKGVTTNSQSVPMFSHPMPFATGTLTKTTNTYLDLRGLVRVQRDGSYKVANATEYELLITRGLLTSHWVTSEDGPRDLSNLGDIAPQIYTRWLAQGITRRLGLSPQEQVKLTVVTTFFWYCLFMKDIALGDEIPENEKRRIVTKLNNISQIPASLSFEIADQMTYMGDMNAYVAKVKEVVDSPRLNNLSAGILISMLGGSWFGVNAREVTAVAIEYPPTFLAIIYLALKERGYRKSTLGSLAYEYDKRDKGREYLRNVNHLLEGMLES